MKRPNALLAAILLAVPDGVVAQPLSYFLLPPGCDWGSLVMTNTTAVGLAACPDGVVVAANEIAPAGPDLDWWGLLAKVSGGDGSVLLRTNFHGEGTHNRITDIIPVSGAGGAVNGFAFTGMKYYSSPPWGGPWVWLVKLDLNLLKQAEAHVGTVSQTGSGYTLIQEPSGFVVGGNDAYMVGGSSWDWLGRFDAALNLIAQTNLPGGCQSVFALAPGIGGGYVAGTGNMSPLDDDCSSVVKINAALGFEWQAADAPLQMGCERDHYVGIKSVPDGYVALGNRACGSAASMVLTKFATDGSIAWSRFNPNGTGADLVSTADGGWLVVGTSPTRRPDDVPCLWLLKTDSLGQPAWEMCLGGEDGASGAAGVVAADGNYIVAGGAIMADGTNRVWVVKVNANQQSPVPSFTFSPDNPVFRDQTVTFNASASTAPGSAIASYEWDFGDGTTGTGVIAEHTYHQPGTNLVTLTVVNSNGVLASTNREIEIVGLAIQWERFYGDGHSSADDDVGYSLVGARDGGFVVAGGTGGSYAGDYDFWVFKTDSRGRLAWSTNINDPNPSSMGIASRVIQAHDTGYVIAGYQYTYTNSNWRYTPWLVGLDEDGTLAWPIRAYGELNRDETAHGVTATLDGGYMITGYRRAPSGDHREPWLLKTDAAGNELWSTNITHASRSGGRFIAPTADGGYLVTGAYGYDISAPPFLSYKTDASGFPLWTNSFASGGSYEGGGRWIAERPGGGVVVGGGNRNMALIFLNPDGTLDTAHAYDDTDMVEDVAFTPDGGYILAGYMTFHNTTYSEQREVTLIKTDSAGNTNWIEILPGTTNRNEAAYGVVALTNNSYVVLAHREVGRFDPDQRSGWLFKLAPNHPPVPRMTFSPSPAAAGTPVNFDGSASTDPDGTVVGWEWEFGEGASANGALVAHTYTNVGSFVVRLTVVDDDGAERSITNWTCAPGIVPLSSGVTLTLAEVTNAPAADPVHYPPAGAPANLDWASAYGFRIGATGANGSKAFRIAFCDPFNTNYVLYRLPAWTSVPYTNVNQAAVDVSLQVAGGVLNTNLVLARAIPACRIVRCGLAGDDRLTLTFTTQSGYRYRVQRSPQLVPAEWQPVNHACALTDPLTLETLDGTGTEQTVFVSKNPGASGFIRVSVEPFLP